MKTQKKLFSRPWRYREGFIIAAFLFITGAIIEIITPEPGITIPSFPFNMYAGMAFVTTLVFLHLFYNDVQVVKWLKSIPAATSSIVLVTALTICMGVFDQTDKSNTGWQTLTGFSHLKNSWVFFLAQIYVLTTLGLITLKRASTWKKGTIGFVLNHGGLWIVIAAASLGTGDLKRYRMELFEGETVWYAFDDSGHVRDLPFALELIKFDIEEYPPQIAIIDSHTGSLSDDSQIPLPYIHTGKTTKLLDWSIEIENYFDSAISENGNINYSDETGAPPFAKVTAINSNSGIIEEGWITCGSFNTEPEYISLDGRNLLVMAKPEPKRYQSHVIALTKNAPPKELFIEVNSPPKIAGWRVYQLSYDQSRGKWSEISVMEVVRDPWLPIVYFGFIMLFAGAVYIFWIGNIKN